MPIKHILIILLCYFLTSCSKVENVKFIEYKASELLFFKSPPPIKGLPLVYPQAAMSGYLVKKENCLYISPKRNSNEFLIGIIWPWNYSKETINNESIIKNGSNEVIATVGGYVNFGGGFITGKLETTYNQCNGEKPYAIFGGYSPRDLKSKT